jgi:hypothetical protein
MGSGFQRGKVEAPVIGPLPILIEPARSCPPVPAVTWGRLLVVLVVVCWASSFLVGFRMALTALTLIGFAGVIVGLSYPSLGVLSIGLLCTLDSLMRIYLLNGGLLRWNTFPYLLLLVTVFRTPLLYSFGGLSMRLLQVFVALLLLEVLISGAYSPGFQHVLGIVNQFGIIAILLHSAWDDETWYWLGIVCGIAGGIGGIAFYYFKSSLTYANPGAVSLMPLTALFALAISFPFVSAPGRMRGIFVLFSVNYALIFLSGSRGNLSIASFCALFLLVSAPGLSRRVFLGVVAALLAAVTISQFSELQEKTLHRLTKTFDSKQSLRSRSSGRSDLILGGWNMFLSHPLGVGTGGFASEYASLGNLEGMIKFHVGHETQAHSGWIKILAENGFPGFLLLVSYVLSFTIEGLKRRGPVLVGLGILVTCTLAIAFLSTEFQGKGLWLLAGSATVLFQTRNDLALCHR